MAKEPKRLWDNYKVIGEVQKSDKIKFIIAAGIRDGVRYINIREFYYRKRDESWQPGRDGITVPLKIPVNNGSEIVDTYNRFIVMLGNTAEALQTIPLSDPENAVYLMPKEAK